MVSQSEFDAWCDRLKLSHQAQELIQRIRTSEPSRNVGGGSKNVFGCYPSRKMGVTIQFESHKVELPTIYQFEHDEDVLEYYDQPNSIKLEYQGKNGRKLGVLHTPDFFVIRNNSAGWEECKTEEQLKKLTDKSPNRYVLSESHQWLCPPGESYASQFQLYYRLRSDSKINGNLQRNLVFLEDYLRTEKLKVEDSVKTKIVNFIDNKPGTTLSELLDLKISADDIYILISTEVIYVDLSSTLLVEPDKCNVFLDSQIAKAHLLMTDSQLENSELVNSPVINLTSYLTRLAESHTVLVGDLVAREIQNIVPKSYKSKDLFCTRHPSGTANSTGTVARHLLLALEKLTSREDLEHLTLLKWSQVFSQRNLIHPVKRWCPVCYKIQYEENCPIYEHLLWFLKVIDICPRHKVYLQSICPHCHQQLFSLSRNSRPGCCSNCGQWLGLNNSNFIAPLNERDWNFWIASNVGEILAATPSISEAPPREKISSSFKMCIEQMTEGNIAAFARLIKFPKNQVWEWSNGKVIPKLDSLLQTSCLTGLSLLDFLTKDNFKTNHLYGTQLTKEKKISRSKQKFNYLLAEASLKKFLSNSTEAPISMSAVAKQLGYHRRTLTNNFPELCKEISANYLKHQKSLRIQRIKECCLEIERAVIQLDSENIYPSEANVSRVLSRPGNLREKEVREALSKARQRLGMNK